MKMVILLKLHTRTDICLVTILCYLLYSFYSNNNVIKMNKVKETKKERV